MQCSHRKFVLELAFEFFTKVLDVLAYSLRTTLEEWL